MSFSMGYGFWKSVLALLVVLWVIVGVAAPLMPTALVLWLIIGAVIAALLYAGGVRFRRRLRGEVQGVRD